MAPNLGKLKLKHAQYVGGVDLDIYKAPEVKSGDVIHQY